MCTLNIKPLFPDFNACVQTMCKLSWPGMFDTVHDQRKAPGSYEELVEEYKRRGRITVWSGASDKTIYDDPQINHMFRAWHDYAHIMAEADFSREGERKAAQYQMDMVTRRYGDGTTSKKFNAIIDCEVNGQVTYFEKNGDFPIDQMEFVKHWVAHGAASALDTVF